MHPHQTQPVEVRAFASIKPRRMAPEAASSIIGESRLAALASVATSSAPLAVPPLVRAVPSPMKAEASRTPGPSARWDTGSGDRSPSPLREIKLEENEEQLLELRPAPGNSRMHLRGLGRRPPAPFPAYLPRIPLPRNKRVSPCSPSECSLGTSGSPDPLDVIGSDHELLVSEQLSEGYGGLSRSGAAESVPGTPVQRDPRRYRSEVCQERKHVFSCRYCRQSSNTSQAAAAAYCFGQRNHQLCTFWQEDGGPEVPPNKRCGQCIAAGGKWAEEAQTCPGSSERRRCFFVRKLDCFECRVEGRYANVTDAPVCPHGGRSTSTVDEPQRAPLLEGFPLRFGTSSYGQGIARLAQLGSSGWYYLSEEEKARYS